MSCNNLMYDDTPKPKRTKKEEPYPKFIPCKYCGFDLWQLLNFRLVSKAVQDSAAVCKGNGANIVGYDVSEESDEAMDTS